MVKIILFALLSCCAFGSVPANLEALRNRYNPKPKPDPLAYNYTYVDLSSALMTTYTK